ncbi:MAG: hypothetical protein AB7T07_13270 [Steroidobacteraceae bacterium]
MSNKAKREAIVRTLNERKISVQCGECKLFTTANWIDARFDGHDWTAVSEVQCPACGLWLYTFNTKPISQGVNA